ncbi:MAG TPA: glutamine-hydrolyzing carbamoyl-phosphate synthase small subunit [Oligoflexia bacterium]|nr:glutamine-hydrolyzing carbamoyl-phosphate synthase small subunit [Oligoflexia bacterium]HMP27717.1 glutamine-hydrolyzing carbamoyl-phosphate synthase small subunit [Oligoflexia bacterium]
MSCEEKEAILVLADGKKFYGKGFGAEGIEVGEVVFNTSLYGYQEILTDPSYAGQLLVFTTPHIGNVGCNYLDCESDKIYAGGVIVRELSPIVNNFRAEQTLDSFLKKHQRLGVSGIDTRELVLHLREKGSLMGALAVGNNINEDDLVDRARLAGSMEGRDYVSLVTCKQPYRFNQLPPTLDNGFKERTVSDAELATRPHCVVIDCGVKVAILRLLVASGFKISVVPATFRAEQIFSMKPDGIFLSNGPGDPATLGYLIDTVRELLVKLPIFGICLGHQILSQVMGAKTYKLKFGHHGGNHPVKNEKIGKVEITVQNHGFAVDRSSLPKDLKITHRNLYDQTIEGVDAPDCRAFAVQYHPESSPGPRDSLYLFDAFYKMVAL